MDQTGIEPIMFKDEEVACVYRKTIPADGVRFLTSMDNPFQIGIHEKPSAVTLPPHIHNIPSPITVNEIQELLYVVRGKIRVTVYAQDKTVIVAKTLTRGDAILLKSQAHSVKFYKNTRVFEVKQGPYPGAAYAKKYIG